MGIKCYLKMSFTCQGYNILGNRTSQCISKACQGREGEGNLGLHRILYFIYNATASKATFCKLQRTVE